jgi:hypothetical protein
MKNQLKSVIITWLGLLVLFYMLFFKYFRTFDIFGIAFAMIICIIMIVISKKIILFSNLIPFYVFSTIILIISIFDGMPDSWTQYRDSIAAFRQWAWLPILTLTASGIFILLCEHWRWIARNALWMAVAIFLFTRLIRIALGELNDINMQFFIYGMDNENSIIAALVFIHMHYNSKTRLNALIIGITFLLMSSSQTSLAAGVVSILALWPRLHKPLIIGIAIAGLTFIATAQVFFREMIYIDPNSSFRGLVWRDSTQILKDTVGFGVGYGTEYIKNDFRGINAEFNRYVEEGASDRLFIGTHSSLYDVAIRTGLLGILLLLIGFIRELRGYVQDQRLANLRIALVGGLIFNNFFNMGLASINVTMGTALFFALASFCVRQQSPVIAEFSPNATFRKA